jgi:hypothetical protein
MYNLQGALLLSAGNKAKARSTGLTLIVSAHYSPDECYWQVGWIGPRNIGEWYRCGSKFSRVEEFARYHGVDLEAPLWFPVEMPFPDEAKEPAK